MIIENPYTYALCICNLDIMAEWTFRSPHFMAISDTMTIEPDTPV